MSQLTQLLDNKLAEIGVANPFAMAALAKEAVNLMAAIIRDHENRLMRVEELMKAEDAKWEEFTARFGAEVRNLTTRNDTNAALINETVSQVNGLIAHHQDEEGCQLRLVGEL